MNKDDKKSKIGILGFGNMGQAIFGLLRKQTAFAKKKKLYICSLGVSKVNGATYIKEKEKLLEKCNIIFLCVKPQEFYQMKFLRYFSKRNPILISIMAGVSIENIEGITGCRKIARAMPNLPLQIGRGVTGWYANKKLFEKDELKFIDNIFSHFGKSLFVSSEDKIDMVTAISGSGPAYVFLFLDAIIKSAVKLGFSKNQAKEMVTETVLGSTEYFLKAKTGTNIGELISKVKSKKGTTEAALNELDVNSFYNMWESAIRKARARSKEISSYEIK